MSCTPVGWADVATKHDLAQLEARLDARIEGSKHEVIAVLRGELAAHTRTIVLALVAAMLGSGGLGLAVSSLG